MEREDAGYSENEESALPDNLSETEGRDELPDLLDSVNGGREDAADVEEEYLSEDSFYETGTRDDGFDEADFPLTLGAVRAVLKMFRADRALNCAREKSVAV